MDTTSNGANNTSNSPADLTVANLLKDITLYNKEKIFQAYCDRYWITPEKYNMWEVKRCFKNYAGWFPSHADFAKDYAIELEDRIPEGLEKYFDYDAFARDLLMEGSIAEMRGYYFRT